MKVQILIFTVALTTAIFLYNQFAHQSNTTSSLHKQYALWMKKYGKNFVGEELTFRMNIYQSNVELIEKHNKEAKNSGHLYTLEANRFASETDQEYKMLHTLKFDRTRSISSHCSLHIEDTPDPKDQIDWTKRAVSPVKKEGLCSASWAFSAIGAVEGLYAIEKSKIVSLSSQQLVDCSKDYGNQGCNGGLMDQGIWYIMDNGITGDDQYAYTGNVSKCQYKPSMQIYKVKDCAEVTSQNYSKLISAVNQQPVAVAVASSQFKFYKQGIYNGDCGQDIDSGMLLIGYGTKQQVDYWRVKSSNGEDWGQQGVIFIQRSKDDGPGKCGIQLFGVVPRGSI